MKSKKDQILIGFNFIRFFVTQNSLNNKKNNLIFDGWNSTNKIHFIFLIWLIWLNLIIKTTKKTCRREAFDPHGSIRRRPHNRCSPVGEIRSLRHFADSCLPLLCPGRCFHAGWKLQWSRKLSDRSDKCLCSFWCFSWF